MLRSQPARAERTLRALPPRDVTRGGTSGRPSLTVQAGAGSAAAERVVPRLRGEFPPDGGNCVHPGSGPRRGTPGSVNYGPALGGGGRASERALPAESGPGRDGTGSRARRVAGRAAPGGLLSFGSAAALGLGCDPGELSLLQSKGAVSWSLSLVFRWTLPERPIVRSQKSSEGNVRRPGRVALRQLLGILIHPVP